MKQESPYRVGVVGLGLIGSVWARHLDEAGLLTACWNRTPRPNAPSFVGTPREVAEQADYVVVVVADPPAVNEVLDAMQPALGARHLVIQSSTIGPQYTEGFRDRAAACGARYLEAPFTGSKPAAETRDLVFYLGDDMECATEAEPVLCLLSRKRIPCGSNIQACTVKLAMNLQIASQAEALCEALYLCRRTGVGDDTFFNCMKDNVCWSGLSALKEPKLREHAYDPQFSIKHMLKDLRLLKESAGDLSILSAMVARLQATAAQNFQDEDFIALYKTLEDPASGS